MAKRRITVEIDAALVDRAQEAGLDLSQAVHAALTEALAQHSRTSYAFGRAALNTMGTLTYEESLEYAQRMLILLAQTDDAREGINAFREARKPVWKG